MVKKETQYAKIAGRHGVSASYVRAIDRGEKAANSDTAKSIKKDLTAFNKEVQRFESRVA